AVAQVFELDRSGREHLDVRERAIVAIASAPVRAVARRDTRHHAIAMHSEVGPAWMPVSAPHSALAILPQPAAASSCSASVIRALASSRRAASPVSQAWA